MKDKTILIVDDAPSNITFLKSVLEETYVIKAAINGVTALKILNKQAPPDLILLDINMPEMDGYEVCRQIKVNAMLKDIPIIFVTSNTSSEEVTKGFEVGGVDYVTKPYNPNELKSRIATHILLKDSREKLVVLANKLGKYLSPEIYQSIFSGEQEVVVGSRKQDLTIFFSDIVDFTPKVEQMDSEELTSWLNSYMNKMAEITMKYGGTLDKFIGDAVMVFFGDPRTRGLEEDAVACIEMACEMVAAAKLLHIDIRVGINSGECFVGNFGSDSRLEYTIIGKNVNVAQRLESNAEAGKILISEATYELVKSRIPCKNNGFIKVKGIERDLNTFWVEK